MPYYATKDADLDGCIEEDAHIERFDTLADAETYLRESCDPDGWEAANLVVHGGTWSDCWVKASAAPRVGDAMLRPFSLRHLSVLRPGQHPGNKAWWITPSAEVLVVRTCESLGL